jgi:2-methylcitrate dehydratase PrpD
MNETRKLVEFVKKLTYKDIPANAVAKAKELILDQLGCQLAGSTTPWSKATYEYINDIRGHNREATVINYGLVTTVADAAFANANFGHALMADDTDSVSNAHLGAIIISAALAVAEREKLSGKEFIEAVVAGYEVSSRIGAAAPLAESRGFHPGPVFGPFGVAASIGQMLGFSEDQILDALAIAGSHSSGLMEYSRSGGTVNRLHAGISAFGGIRAVAMVQKGFTGPASILEGERGFVHAYSGEACFGEISHGLGRNFRILLNGLKTNCCCGTLGACLDAVSDVTKKYQIHPQDVDKIIMHVSPATFNLTGNIKEPKDITSAQFSGRFSIALRILKGANTFREYTEANLKDSQIQALAAKTDYVLDEELAKLPNSDNPATVVMVLKDGTVLQETALAGKGTIQNPMTQDEVAQKFESFASTVLPSSKIIAITETVMSLESVSDIRELVRLLVLA